MMKNISLQRILVALVIIILGYVVFNLFKPKKDDREYLLSLPSFVADLAEKRQAPEIRRLISPDYSDERSRKYQDLNAIITGHTLRKGEISVYTWSTHVELELTKNPPLAVLSFKAALARGPKQASVFDIVPDTADIYEFILNLEKTDDGWLIKSGHWQPSTLTE